MEINGRAVSRLALGTAVYRYEREGDAFALMDAYRGYYGFFG